MLANKVVVNWRRPPKSFMFQSNKHFCEKDAQSHTEWKIMHDGNDNCAILIMVDVNFAGVGVFLFQNFSLPISAAIFMRKKSTI